MLQSFLLISCFEDCPIHHSGFGTFVQGLEKREGLEVFRSKLSFFGDSSTLKARGLSSPNFCFTNSKGRGAANEVYGGFDPDLFL
ncbi:hypothetical protein CDAR_470401 [Caerostris darwini]|uniref:Uncharacterized protein n=1 Tax=Caerostris darwini TaxID=1538125 RepID=A0AAV4VHB8_9ARAC|nr:hypothetical protein CDAR_470401 [Caerostris darwini]